MQKRLKAKGGQEGLARLAALTGKSRNAPLRMTKVKGPYGVIYHDIDPATEHFANCDQGNKLLARARRKGYELPT